MEGVSERGRFLISADIKKFFRKHAITKGGLLRERDKLCFWARVSMSRSFFPPAFRGLIATPGLRPRTRSRLVRERPTNFKYLPTHVRWDRCRWVHASKIHAIYFILPHLAPIYKYIFKHVSECVCVCVSVSSLRVSSRFREPTHLVAMELTRFPRKLIRISLAPWLLPVKKRA